jgi:hypothetical protein
MYSHTTDVYLNSQPIGYTTIQEGKRTANFSVPPEALSSFVGGASANTLSLQSIHNNSAHYSVGGEFYLRFSHSAYTSQQCSVASAARFDTRSAVPDCQVQGGILEEPELQAVVNLVPAFPGIRNELQDMRAVADATGLFVHDGPTWNAMRLRVIPWGVQITVDRKMTLPNGELWVRLVAATPDENDGWVNLRHRKDGTIYRYFVGKQPNLIDLLDGETISFTYDRQAAAEYAIIHSYDRNTVKRPSNRATLYLENVDLPYAESIYNTSGTAEGTFSAIFISESLWSGGMPMMSGLDENCNPTVQSNAGWRYCSNQDTGSQPWNLHKALGVVFTTGNFPIPEYSIVSNLIDNETKGEQIFFHDINSSLISEYIEPVVDLEETLFITLRDGGERIFDPIKLDEFSRKNLSDLEMGDYMWIYPQGAFAHGLLVVGWQEHRKCSDVLSDGTDPTFEVVDFYSSVNNAVENILLVPYVADLTTVHSPMPRPFYCTWYFQDDERPTFLSTEFTGFADHRMRFYRMPNQVIIGSGEGTIYADFNWSWERAE